MSSSFQDAMNALRAWHYRAVRDLADAAISEMEDAAPENREEWLSEWLHETIDGHEHVIYTAQAQATLTASDNSDAFVDSFGVEGLTGGDAVNWPALAYCAIEADVRQLLEARRDEWDHPNPETEED